MYGAERVETFHILLAAVEVTPVELHGYAELTPVSISDALAAMHVENASKCTTELVLPKDLSPGAHELITNATSFASGTRRDPTLRDIWVALSQEHGLVSKIFEYLGVDRSELYRQVSGS